jgi:hypothetical protein
MHQLFNIDLYYMQVQFIIVFVFSTQAGAAASEILLMINFITRYNEIYQLFNIN